MRRALVLGTALAAVLALGGVTAAQRDARPEARFPSVANLRLPSVGPIHDRVLPAGARAPQAKLTPGFGGPYTVSTGETVNVFLSDSYQPDSARAQAWADLVAGFVHGEELESVTVYVAPLDEVHEICGDYALACYRGSDQRLIVPGDVPDPSVTIEQIAAHEYGHHIANNRANAPWEAFDWGPKRWATYLQICEKAAAGTVFPGDEGADYKLNPGEGWAEAYRRLNEVRHADWPALPWDVVDASFQPDDAALQVVEQDVTSPWLPTTSEWTGKFRFKGQILTRHLSTRYDGLVIVVLGGPKRSVVRLRAAGTTTTLASTRSSFKYTSCGHREFDLLATAGAKGRFTAQILVP